MRVPITKSLRYRQGVLVLILVLPYLLITAYIYTILRNEAKERVQNEALLLVHALAKEQEGLITNAETLLSSLVEIHEIQKQNLSKCNSILTDAHREHPFFLTLLLVSLDGEILCGSHDRTEEVNLYDRLYFQDLIETHSFVVSDYLVGRITGKCLIAMAFPIINDEQSLTSALVAGVDLTWFYESIEEVDLPIGSVSMLVDRNGVILARNEDMAYWVGQKVPEKSLFNKTVRLGNEGTIELKDLDGIERLYAYVPLTSDWKPIGTVFIGIPIEEAYKNANHVLLLQMLTVGLVGIAALITEWLILFRYVFKPIDKLILSTRKLQAGDLSERSGFNQEEGEIGELGIAFDQMAESLENRDEEKKLAIEELQRTNRALKMLSACNQALIHSKNEVELLQKVCDVIVVEGGYRMAWIGYVFEGEEKITPIVQSRFENGSLVKNSIHIGGDVRMQDLSNRTVQRGEAIAIQNEENEPVSISRHDAEPKEGFNTPIEIPIFVHGEIQGALFIHSDHIDAFQSGEEEIIKELTSDLSFGITSLRTRAKHAQAEVKIENQLKNLKALRTIDVAISSSLDLDVTLDILIQQVKERLGVDAVCVLLLEPETMMLQYAVGTGFRTETLKNTKLSVGEGYAGWAALEKRIVKIPDLTTRENGFGKSERFAKENFISYFAVPLVAKGSVQGVLEIFQRRYHKPDEEWLNFLNSLSIQAAIAIDNAILFRDLQSANMNLMLAYDTTLEGWSRAIEMRDEITEGHTRRVIELTLLMARKLGIKESDLINVRRGALLHDIGKLGVPDRILLKPGPLTDEEWAIMKQHPVLAFDWLFPIKYLRNSLEIPLCHHEKWDGSGYPRGLKGDQIPLEARIFAVADVWDALHSDRPYRKAWSKENVIEYIKENSGKHFDPTVVEAFLKLYEEGLIT